MAPEARMSLLRRAVPFIPGLCLGTLALIPSSSYAQSADSPKPAAVLRGRILDSSCAPIQGARISAASLNGVWKGSAVTDPLGEFSMAVDPGRYTVAAVADGFSESSRTVTASAGTAAIEFILQVAGVRETLDVSAAAEHGVRVISSSTKTPTPLIDVPQSVTVISRELIAD